MPIETVTDKYVTHTLQLIRVANALARYTTGQISLLAVKLRRLLATVPSLASSGPRNLTGTVKQIDEVLGETFQNILEHQKDAAGQLIEIDAMWAKQTGKYKIPVSDAALTRAKNQFQVMGNTLTEQWQKQMADLRFKITTQIRQGAIAGNTNTEIIERIAGSGRKSLGGVLEKTQRQAKALVDATAQAAADAGRREAMKANGINALQWHAVLDLGTNPGLCPSCGERAGKLWDLDGNPIGHTIVYMSIPLHPHCHCIYLPMKFPNGPPADGGKGKNKFADFLAKLDEAEQNEVLGTGRAELWRDDKLSLSELIGQDGFAMPLRDFRDAIAKGG